MQLKKDLLCGKQVDYKNGKSLLERHLAVAVISYHFQHCELHKLNSIHLYLEEDISVGNKTQKIFSKYQNILLYCGWTI